MASLADLPEVIGFFSYSRDDDESYKGRLSALREAFQHELSAQLGRSKTSFRLWQDKEAIAPGKLWELEIQAAVEQSVFFIPIVTPRAVNSGYCKFEFKAFLARERALGRADLVFPILYVPVPALANEAQWRNHPVLSVIGKRQYVDWQTFRYSDIHTPAMREDVARFCNKIVEALHQSWLSPEERRRQEEAEAQQRAEDEWRRQDAETERRFEQEARHKKDDAESQRIAEKRRRQEAAEAQKRAKDERRPQEADDKHRVDEEERRKQAAAKVLWRILFASGCILEVIGWGLVFSRVSFQDHTFDPTNLIPCATAFAGGNICIAFALIAAYVARSRIIQFLRIAAAAWGLAILGLGIFLILIDTDGTFWTSGLIMAIGGCILVGVSMMCRTLVHMMLLAHVP